MIAFVSALWAVLKLIKGFLPEWMLDIFLKAFGIWSNNEIASKRIDAEVEIADIEQEKHRRREARKMLEIDSGWWVTRWMRPFVFYPVATLWGALHVYWLLKWDGPSWWDWHPQIPEWDILILDGSILTLYIGSRAFEKAVRLRNKK